MTRFLTFVPFVVLAAAGCIEAPDTETDAADVPDDGDGVDGKADTAARPMGVYARNEATDGQLTELMLFADHTFLRYEAAGDLRIRGTFTFTRSTASTKRYIRFLDQDGTLIDRYVYTMAGSVVRLHLDSEPAAYPMFSVATGAAAWTEAVKTDWFDEAFQDWGAEAFPRTAIRRADLPAAARTVYDQIAATMPSNTVPQIYRFDLHGRRGFELDADKPTVRLFDDTGHQVASGDGDSLFDFTWH